MPATGLIPASPLRSKERWSAVTAPQRRSAHRWLTRSWQSVHPFATGAVYQGYPDPDLANWATAYYGTNLDRLQAVKAQYDPLNVFRHAQSIVPTVAIANVETPTSHPSSAPR